MDPTTAHPSTFTKSPNSQCVINIIPPRTFFFFSLLLPHPTISPSPHVAPHPLTLDAAAVRRNVGRDPERAHPVHRRRPLRTPPVLHRPLPAAPLLPRGTIFSFLFFSFFFSSTTNLGGWLQAARLLGEALADMPPIEVRLAKFGHFKHAKSATLFLEPEFNPPGNIHYSMARTWPHHHLMTVCVCACAIACARACVCYYVCVRRCDG